MNDTVVTILWIVLFVGFGLPLILEGFVRLIFGVVKEFTNVTFDAGKSLIIPALIIFAFKYFHDRKKETDDRINR